MYKTHDILKRCIVQGLGRWTFGE